jgi:hypothetical protein
MGIGKDKEGKGKGKEREGEENYFKFCSFGSFRNGFEIPKQTERGDYILLYYKIPKQNRNCQCFGLFRLEPKEKKIRFAGVYWYIRVLDSALKKKNTCLAVF